MGIRPATLEMFTMAPLPLFAMSGMKAWQNMVRGRMFTVRMS